MTNNLYRKAALEKLSSPEELDQLMQVTTPKGWFSLIAVIALMALGISIGTLGKIPVRTTSTYCVLFYDPVARELSATLYVPPVLNERPIRTGYEVHILPFGISPDQAGFMIGAVTRATTRPVERAQIERVVEDEDEVDRLLTENRQLIEVRVDLSRAQKTDANPVGYQWSSGREQDMVFENRTPCEATITIAEKSPFELILRDFQS